MRESGEPALFVSCGEVEKVDIVENKLIARTEKQYIFDLISSSQSVLAIKRALRFLGLNFEFGVELVPGENSKILEDVKLLKDKFGDFVTIIED